MRTSLGLLVSSSALLATALLVSGCRCYSYDDTLYAAPATDGERAGSANASAPSAAEASRVIAEADIVQLDQEQLRIYAMSRSGAVAVVDAATPGKLALLGKASLPGEPFEMYRRGDVLLTMSNGGVAGDGQIKPAAPADSDGMTAEPEPDPVAGALIQALDVSDPTAMKPLVQYRVPGQIADSRIVGDVLYLVTYENAACYQCATEPRTLVTTFDVANPVSPKYIDQAAFPGAASNFKRSVIATKERLYVGGVADAAPATNDAVDGQGRIDVLDITDGAGHLVKGASLRVPGPITSRWQMDESEGVLRVVSQRGVLTSRIGTGAPEIDTFRVASSSSIVPLGHTQMKLPRQEGLKSVRFDGPRAYAITFAETDPLFTIDLSDPVRPAQKGELVIPGWVFHLEPRGDRLIGLGLDRRSGEGNLNVSLFDVSSMERPTMIDRQSFGPLYAWDDTQLTSALAEDQDRIQKAFRIFQDGLITVPYSGSAGGSAGDACSGVGGNIALLSWTRDTLVKHAEVPMAGNPRRAVRRDSDTMSELIGISDSNVTSFDITTRSAPAKTADVVIGRCVPKASPAPIPSPSPDRQFEDHGYYEGSGSCW